VGNIDASAVSLDHANSVEAALAEKIEVVCGPATLLYGNGAMGGVVNVIDNSNTRAAAITAGMSWVFDQGYIGLAVSRSESKYGLPAAAHHHDDHADKGGIRIVMKQNRYDLEGRAARSGFFSDMQGKFSMVDYQHAEIEGDGEIGTVYSSDGNEGRFSFTQTTMGALDGVIGFQFGARNFSAIGEEAYIPKTDIHSYTMFTV
jgi:iron complex outermembrane receptor protein